MNKFNRIFRRLSNMCFYILSYRKRHRLKIMDTHKTVRDIIENKKSISRFGDGEFDLIFNYLQFSNNECGFQKYTPELGARLIEIFTDETIANFIIGIPGCIGTNGLMSFRWEEIRYWQNYLRNHLNHFYTVIPCDRTYGDANFTRFYLPLRNKSKTKVYVDYLKKIWYNRDVLIIEGIMTRLGVNNDLLDGAKSIRRILAPAKNAFNKYNDIYNTAISYLKEQKNDTLVLISLGATATVLTYDLSKAGYQTIDSGHIDLEYEWMLRGVKKKVKVVGKFVNEVAGEDIETDNDKNDYESQIIAIIQ